MKVRAAEIKKGMTIKYANVWGEALEDAKPGNRKGEVTVKVRQLAGTVKHRGSMRPTRVEERETTFDYRAATMINLK